MEKPCQAFHGDYQSGCAVCKKWRSDPRYARLKNAPAPPMPRVATEVAGACVHRGEPTGETVTCPSCSGRVTLKVYGCAVHGSCTLGKKAGELACCKSCPDRQANQAQPKQPKSAPPPATKAAPAPRATPGTFEWVSTADLARDAVLLAGLLPPDISGVAGVPRSGMAPAAIVATMLHVPLYELTPAGQLHECGSGVRGQNVARPAGPLAVVDDTVYSGQQMRRIRKQLGKRPVILSAVYCEPRAKALVDVFARELNCPHLLQWNLFNCGVSWGMAAPSTKGVFGAGVATDLDGILCHDDQSGGKPGTPFMLPRMHALPLIVTGRRESARPQTEVWLRQHRAKYGRLAMLPDDADHTSGEAIAAFKAKEYAASGCGFFVESEPKQATAIARLSGKPTICPRLGMVFQG